MIFGPVFRFTKMRSFIQWNQSKIFPKTQNNSFPFYIQKRGKKLSNTISAMAIQMYNKNILYLFQTIYLSPRVQFSLADTKGQSVASNIFSVKWEKCGMKWVTILSNGFSYENYENVQPPFLLYVYTVCISHEKPNRTHLLYFSSHQHT